MRGVDFDSTGARLAGAVALETLVKLFCEKYIGQFGVCVSLFWRIQKINPKPHVSIACFVSVFSESEVFVGLFYMKIIEIDVPVFV